MDNAALPTAREPRTLRWTARFVGLLFVGIFLALFIPDWLTKGRLPVEREGIPMTIALFTSFGGLLLAWKWDGVGGILAVVGIVAFAALGLQTPVRPGGIVLLGVMYLLPAALFILSWQRRRLQDRAPRQTTQP